MSKTINCPKCQKETSVDINRAVDEDAEVYVCQHCGFVFRYVHNPQYSKSTIWSQESTASNSSQK
jgi:transcription elongation factor Elf1